MVMFLVLAIGHIAIGVILLPVALLFGGIIAPILMVGPIWGIILGVRLWRSPFEGRAAVRRTHWTFLLIDGLLVVYGIFSLPAAERSAGHRGGMLGGIEMRPPRPGKSNCWLF